ncbi:GntR family transcriptional regulator [Paenibacillus sp. MBLB4367]|uniref:GntR family transcriptional regulator n=1 Tax=Paenibacillus sp. MBLB4367 TaxID=3384767 RepID=UPI0039081D9F
MAKFQFKNQEAMPLRQKVATDIRNAIIQGDLKPGEKLREQEISEQMGISRGPVREALRDLAAMGLVMSLPYKETVVADVQKEEIVDLLLPIRLQLELYAIKYSLNRIDEEEIGQLRESIDRMKRYADDDDIAGLVDEDIRFHEQILCLCSDSSYTQQIWTGIVNRMRLHFMKNTRHYSDLRRVAEDHALLVEALVSKDLARISEAWEKHIRDEECLLYL